ncbi:MAG: hypothetical protein MRY64_08875 [Hyphomonadaceae bacterium]|nr:hypothetical protein [Hyphomonadaceae bacterium]
MKRHSILLVSAASILTAACTTTPAEDTLPAEAPAAPEVTEEIIVEEVIIEKVAEVDSAALLSVVLEVQPEEAKARYAYRHPAETLEFFGIEPGMTVVEALPGGGWYSKILIPYLGPEGELIGWHYPDGIWAHIIPGADEERIAEFIARGNGWAAGTADWGIEDGASVSQFKMAELPEEAHGTADAVLFIRALHNLKRTETETGYFTAAIKESYAVLKPGGVVGVVQHRGPADNSADWADGSAGYLHEADIIAAFGAAGFVLDAKSEINANPADQPTEDDIVWRLPPTRGGTEEGTPERAAVDAIGESDRMTLRFIKPN